MKWRVKMTRTDYVMLKRRTNGVNSISSYILHWLLLSLQIWLGGKEKPLQWLLFVDVSGLWPWWVIAHPWKCDDCCFSCHGSIALHEVICTREAPVGVKCWYYSWLLLWLEGFVNVQRSNVLVLLYRVVLDLRSPQFDGGKWPASSSLYCPMYSRYCTTSYWSQVELYIVILLVSGAFRFLLHCRVRYRIL